MYLDFRSENVEALFISEILYSKTKI